MSVRKTSHWPSARQSEIDRLRTSSPRQAAWGLLYTSWLRASRPKRPPMIWLRARRHGSNHCSLRHLVKRTEAACGDLLEQKRAPSVYNGRGLGPQLGDYNALSRGHTPPAIIRDRGLDPGVWLPWPDNLANPCCGSTGLAMTSTLPDRASH
ncbi:hypothetical protein Nepgr_025062 [Nepenthes gracilis]|uniref:Uncharacterized protein n=1 Tax=Nepenthes gracilis TaxID=150966 RepID=A0AAD3Y0M3_NEPGR|nr:hypothetical protein Nepgr_025062 [Nepenthes gracilis]